MTSSNKNQQWNLHTAPKQSPFTFWINWKKSKLISYLITCTKGSKNDKDQNQVKYFSLYPFVEEVQLDNGTVVSEVRYKDGFFEKLLSQLLKDYLSKIDLGEKTIALSGPFNKSFSGFGYEATIEIYNIKVIQEVFSKNKNS